MDGIAPENGNDSDIKVKHSNDDTSNQRLIFLT